MERRRLFLVKGAKPDVVPAATFELDGMPDKLDDIDGLQHPSLGIARGVGCTHGDSRKRKSPTTSVDIVPNRGSRRDEGSFRHKTAVNSFYTRLNVKPDGAGFKNIAPVLTRVK
jgi:hypothetical protein